MELSTWDIYAYLMNIFPYIGVFQHQIEKLSTKPAAVQAFHGFVSFSVRDLSGLERLLGNVYTNCLTLIGLNTGLPGVFTTLPS